MNDYEEQVKQLQAEAEARLQKMMAASKRKSDPFRAERRLLITELVTARHARKLSQGELAAKSGVRQPAISRLENDRGNPSLHTLLMIADALDVNLVLEYKD